MKTIRHLFVLLIIAMAACNDGYIDDINAVDPGPDQASPTISFSNLTDTVAIPFTLTETDLVINFTVSDDIELTSVMVDFNGENVSSFETFIDYRNLQGTVTIEALGVGNHSVSITATDLSGKESSSTIDFLLTNEYFPLAGEVFYMPFEGGEFEDIISEASATPSGNPGFVEGVFGSAVEFSAQNSSYLTFPANEEIAGLSNFTLSFWTFVDFIDEDENGIVDGALGLVNLSNSNNFWGNIDIMVENGSNPTNGAEMKLHFRNGDTDTWIEGLERRQNIFGRWSHHAVVYNDDATSFAYYINGEEISSVDAVWENGLVFQDAERIVMGCLQFQTDPSSTSAAGAQEWASYLTGEIDEVKIFNRVLSESEVQTLFNANNPN